MPLRVSRQKSSVLSRLVVRRSHSSYCFSQVPPMAVHTFALSAIDALSGRVTASHRVGGLPSLTLLVVP